MADPSDLMPIGAFAKLAELTASALRFYDDAGVLRPEQVDPLTGYRLYRASQLQPTTQVRRLRELGMPLPMISTFLAAGPEEAARLIDEQLARVAAEANGAQRAAAALKASIGHEGRLCLGALSGPVLAAAVDQVLTTTIHDPQIPVLDGVRLESGTDAITLTATDRYRLVTRTLVPHRPSTAPWAGTLAGDDLRAATSRLRRSPSVALEAGEQTLSLHLADDSVAHCRLLTEDFPDHRLLIESLPPITHRLTLEKQQTVRLLEQHAADKVGLRVANGHAHLLLPDDAQTIAGSATGPDLSIWFELTTLYPALSQALGALTRACRTAPG